MSDRQISSTDPKFVTLAQVQDKNATIWRVIHPQMGMLKISLLINPETLVHICP